MKIYIAHNYAARQDLRLVVSALLRYGHEITSRWITDDSIVDGLDAKTARMGLDDIDRAYALLLFTDNFGDRPGKGKYVELGYAIASGKKIFLIGQDTSCVFYHLPHLVRIQDLREIPV